jgi:hypothetical protein
MTKRKALSESEQWARIEEIGRKLSAHPDLVAAKQGRELMATAVEMLGQLKAGYHENPSLVIYGNPRGRLKVGASIVGSTIRVEHQLAKDLHELRYQHAKNGDDFKHAFEGGVQVWAIERNGQREFLITHPDGLPVWDLFED